MILGRGRGPSTSICLKSGIHPPMGTTGLMWMTKKVRRMISQWRGSEKGEPTVGDQLSAVQKSQLNKVLETFSDVMSSIPGRTTEMEHQVTTIGTRPVRVPPYRLPHAYRDLVEKEIQEMLVAGVIEPSSSEWASPIVLVGKKDGTLRFCIDYRRLNSESLADAYPMPRIDDLIDRLGKARYISTLDLTRGYWQVPMAKASRHLTAFTTPFGLFQFRVMPFGLQGLQQHFSGSWTRSCKVWRTMQLLTLMTL